MLKTLEESGLLRDRGFIDGCWLEADQGGRFPVRNPATGEVLAMVADMGAEETRRAIDSAAQAQIDWAKMTARARAVILRNWYDLIIDHQDELAWLMTAEQGKPIAESLGEVRYGAAFVEWFAEEARRVYGEVIPSHTEHNRLLTVKQPVGVTAAITPWNFPIAMITRKAAPALAAGCSMVVKPSDETPLCALALAALAERAGVPAGVLNVVTGKAAAPIGGELTGNPIVRKVSFTGSTAVGKLLLAQCAEGVKRTSMELGGNAPFIVFDDADLDAAVEGAMASKFRNAGQTCVCANRILVQASVYDAFAEKLTQRAEQLKMGEGTQDKVQIGPLINQAAIVKVRDMVNQSLAMGARCLTERRDGQDGTLFYPPTVLADVTTDMPVFKQEVFGPVAPLVSFDTEEEGIRLANQTTSGLAAYFYAADQGRIWRVAEGLEYGMVGINEGLISTEVAPFGGVKESGLGREGSFYGIEEYLETKYLCLGVGKK